MNATLENANARQQPGESTNQNTQVDNTSNTAEAQRNRILNRLRLGPANTIELRKNLDCLMPAARVHELRHRFGLNITTVWTQEPTDSGKLHRVGLYVLQSEVAA